MSDRFSNAPLSEEERRAFGGWNPKNASPLPIGSHSLTVGLAFSDNLIAVRTGGRVGLSQVRDALAKAGLIAPGAKINPSALLGTVEATVAEVTSAYSAGPRGGTRTSPRLVRSVKVDGKLAHTARPSSSPVFSRPTCAAVHCGLRAAITNGTSARAATASGLRAPVAGKTGTSQNAADIWWVGYVEDFTLGIHFGRDSNKPISESASGGRIAAPAAMEILKRLSERLPMNDPYSAGRTSSAGQTVESTAAR